MNRLTASGILVGIASALGGALAIWLLLHGISAVGAVSFVRDTERQVGALSIGLGVCAAVLAVSYVDRVLTSRRRDDD